MTGPWTDLEATGSVTLSLDGRWVTGEHLVYYEAEGRYAIEGAPVTIVEEVEPAETAPTTTLRRDAAPRRPSCSSTTGRTLALYRSTDTVTVDGRAVAAYTDKQRRLHAADVVVTCPTPARMATLETLNLTKTYSGRTVVRDVSLSVASGEVVGLLGPNGAGKTTTFYLVVGLTAPDQGQVTLNGQDVTNDPMYLRARKGIGYLPQEPSIFRGLTVEQNILAILETLGLSRAARRDRVRELLEELNLTPLAKSPAHTLSGGERRRAEITRALVISPSFMLLDEPFAGIDPIAITDIQEIIFHLKARGIGVLITDHNVGRRCASPIAPTSCTTEPCSEAALPPSSRATRTSSGSIWVPILVWTKIKARSTLNVPGRPQQHGASTTTPDAAVAETHLDACPTAGHQAAADDDARARRHAEPGSCRKPDVGGGPQRGAAATGDRQSDGEAGRAAGRRGKTGFLGRRRLRVFLWRLPRRWISGARTSRGQRASANREHALHPELAGRSSDVAAVAPEQGRRSAGAGDWLSDHRQPR